MARSVDIIHYLKEHGYEQHIYAKIDIEGFDSPVISGLMRLVPARLVSIIFEFTPRSFESFGQAASYLRELSQSFYLFDLFYSPNPTRCKPITPSQVDGFVAEIFQRIYGYTDVFLLDKRIPQCDRLLQRLSCLIAEPDRIVL
jgi:hypothetical protein